MGETAIDEETFQEYLNEMKEHYTADKVSPLALCMYRRSSSYSTTFSVRTNLGALRTLTSDFQLRFQLQLIH